jgi:hypothetical protein
MEEEFWGEVVNLSRGGMRFRGCLPDHGMLALLEQGVLSIDMKIFDADRKRSLVALSAFRWTDHEILADGGAHDIGVQFMDANPERIEQVLREIGSKEIQQPGTSS